MNPSLLKSHLAGLGFVTVTNAPDKLEATIRTSKHSVETAHKRARERLASSGAAFKKGADHVLVTFAK